MPIDDLRSALRKARENLNGAQREEAAGRCAQRARTLPALQRARCIAAYMAHRGEMSCEPIIEWARGRGASVLLPVVVGRHMRFTPCHPGETLTPNRWGILEPERRPRRWVSAIRPSVVLMPLVAFDSAGNRLGQGGGSPSRPMCRWMRCLPNGRSTRSGADPDCGGSQRGSILPSEGWKPSLPRCGVKPSPSGHCRWGRKPLLHIIAAPGYPRGRFSLPPYGKADCDQKRPIKRQRWRPSATPRRLRSSISATTAA